MPREIPAGFVPLKRFDIGAVHGLVEPEQDAIYALWKGNSPDNVHRVRVGNVHYFSPDAVKAVERVSSFVDSLRRKEFYHRSALPNYLSERLSIGTSLSLVIGRLNERAREFGHAGELSRRKELSFRVVALKRELKKAGADSGRIDAFFNSFYSSKAVSQVLDDFDLYFALTRKPSLLRRPPSPPFRLP